MNCRFRRKMRNMRHSWETNKRRKRSCNRRPRRQLAEQASPGREVDLTVSGSGYESTGSVAMVMNTNNSYAGVASGEGKCKEKREQVAERPPPSRPPSPATDVEGKHRALEQVND